MSKDGYLAAEELEVELEIAEAMTGELEDYIIGDDLYRTVIVRTSSGDMRLNMSGGDLLARLGRLQGEREALSADEQKRLDMIRQNSDATIYSLNSRFMQRLNWELKARLDSLRWFMAECDEDGAKCRAEYPFEMRNRQRIEEIVKRLGDQAAPALLASLNQVDQRITNHTRPTDFIWDRRLEKVYPPQPYWYLYRRP